MNPFYALNKTLDDIRNEPTEQQKALVESQVPKSPAKKTLEEALRSDLRSLMEDATGGMSGSNTLESSMPDYLYLAVKIGDLFIKLHDQGKIFSHEDFEKIKDRVANHLGYSLGDRIFEKAWLEANSEPNLDNDDSDYTDYSMGQGEMGRYNESKDKSLSQAAKTVKKGALHKQEGIPQDKKIGDKKLNSLKKSGTPLEKKRANFALNIQGKGKKSVKENMSMDDCNECMMGECSVHGLNELSRGTVVGYQTKAQPELRKLKQQPVDDFVSNMRQGHRIGDAANMAVQNNLKAIKKAKIRGAGLDRANARVNGEHVSETWGNDYKPGDKVNASGKPATWIGKAPSQPGAARYYYVKFDGQKYPPGTMDTVHGNQVSPAMAEGATPDQFDQQKLAQMKRAAATRKNSRAVQQQPAQSGPRRSEVPTFIRKGRGDPELDYRDLEETNMYSESDKDILDYLKAKLVPNGGNARAKSVPYNGSADDADAYNGMEFEESDEYSRHTTSKSPAGGTVYTRKYDPDTGLSIGTDTGSSAPAASDGPRKRGRQPGTKFSGGYAARHDGSHVSKAKMDSRKKDMDEGSATCPHCGHAMADEGRELDMEGVKNGMGSFVKAAKKIGGVASAVKKAKKDYDGDGKIETGPEEHAGSVDKAIKANKAKTKDKPATKTAKQTKEGAKPDFLDIDKDGDKKEPMKKAAKEKKVDETTTSGSVSTAPAKKSSGGSGVGKGIYDSWERKYESLLKEDVNVTTNSSKNDEGEEEEHITIDVSGDDVARIKEMLHNMGVSHGGDEAGHAHGDEEACDSCGGVPCQCDEGLGGALAGAAGGALTGGPVGAAIGGISGAMSEDDMEEATSFKDAGSTVGRIGGTIAGGLGGFAAGGPVGAVAGGIAGGSAGSALGTAGGRWLDKKTGAPEETDEGIASTVIGGALGAVAKAGGKAIGNKLFGNNKPDATNTPAAPQTGTNVPPAPAATNPPAAPQTGTNVPPATEEMEHQRMMELAGLGEANVAYSDNEPDYPSNQEYSNDEMQYSGGLNGKKSTGQTTLPVVGSQVRRLHSHVSEGQRMSDLYKAIQAIENKEV